MEFYDLNLYRLNVERLLSIIGHCLDEYSCGLYFRPILTPLS